MRRFVVFGLLIIACSAPTGAQQLLLADTIQLEEIISYGKLQKYQSGAKIEKIANAGFNLAQDGNLEQLLSRAFPVSFKADAGGLSTIRIRGTAPGHTSVNFGGIDINSLTLGQSNMSSVPVYLFDEVGLQFGSSSSVNGSGSIGGAIHLGLKNNWTDGFKTQIRLANGSFGEQLYGAKLFRGNGKFEWVTRAYYYRKTNDFTFVNPYYRDFENKIFAIKDRQHNSGIERMGLLQELNYKFAENEVLLVRAWLENSGYDIQQNMQTNLYQPKYKETYKDDHVRVWAEYKNQKRAFKYQLAGGSLFDNSVFNGNAADYIQTSSYLTDVFVEHDYSKEASYKIGAKATRIYPRVYAYSKSIGFEDRVDFYFSYYHRFFNKLTASVNLRQGNVTNYKVPFTPALGLNFLALSKQSYSVNVSGNIAKSYRVPTFNDRFWIPGGNPRLKPEKGMNYELGTKFNFWGENHSGNLKINAFYLNIDDWILWKSGGNFWYAENIQKVESKGIEIVTDLNYQIGKIKAVSGCNYSYTSTQRVNSLISSNAINRQLEYVPKHGATVFHTSQFKNFDFTLDGSFIDRQYTDEETKNILDAYFLLNLNAGYALLPQSNHKIRINGAIKNLLNSNYQSGWGYAMPGIGYLISLTYNFK